MSKYKSEFPPIDVAYLFGSSLKNMLLYILMFSDYENI